MTSDAGSEPQFYAESRRPVVFGVMLALQATTAVNTLTLVLFIATMLVEVIALTQVLRARRLSLPATRDFSPGP